MSASFNPYAPPQSAVDETPAAVNGALRDGQLVRVDLDGALPDRCTSCNDPAEGYRAERSVYWRPVWWRWVLWAGPPVLLVLSGVDPIAGMLLFPSLIGLAIGDAYVRTKVVIAYGLCPRHRRLRSGVFAVFVGSWAAVIGLIAANLALPTQNWVQQGWFWALVIAMFVLAVGAAVINRFRLKRLEGERMWLQGMGRAFRDSLPAAS